ncbi:hypothetical protein niasHT_022983 [Heterodera trifolii]|uniref:Uncharacterized protein n=1 Tax=Heterodera trifolii TaxID=157864 RepID=A0ABD2JNB3_9BILA
MPFLPPPLPLPLIGAGCCPCCMPMCVPICIRSSCGMFGGGGGCSFGGGWKQKKARQKRDMDRSEGTVISREMKDEMSEGGGEVREKGRDGGRGTEGQAERISGRRRRKEVHSAELIRRQTTTNSHHSADRSTRP